MRDHWAKPGVQLLCIAERHDECGLQHICTCYCHLLDESNQKGTIMQCPECNETFKNQHGLRIHQGRTHKDNYRVSIISAHRASAETLLAELEAISVERGLPFADVCEAAVRALRASCP